MDTIEARRKEEELRRINAALGSYDEEKKLLELELSSEQFHYDHIADRYDLEGGKLGLNLLVTVPLGFICLVCIGIFTYGMWVATRPGFELTGNQALAIFMLLSVMVLVYTVPFLVRLLREQYDAAKHFVSFKETFQKEKVDRPTTLALDKERSAAKLEHLRKEMERLDAEIQRMVDKKAELEGLVGTQKLWTMEGTADVQVQPKSKTSFSLNERVVEEAAKDYDQSVSFEEKQVLAEIKELEDQIQEQKNIRVTINSNYMIAKNRSIAMFLYGLAALMLSFLCYLIGGIICNNLSELFGIVSFVLWMILLYRLYRTDGKCFFAYWVEQEKPSMKDYAFTHDMKPTSAVIKDIQPELEYKKLQLERIQNRRK